jgi:hypothetical protein
VQSRIALRRAVRVALSSEAVTHPSWGLRPVIAASVVVTLFSVAAAMSGRFRRPALEPAPSVSPAVSLATTAHAQVTKTIPAAEAEAAADEAAPIPPPTAQRKVRPAPAARLRHASTAVPAPGKIGTEAVPVPSPASAEELGLYLDGVRALRADREFGRAAELLGRYRVRYPNGAFIEEALALSIEAAASADRSTRALADEYLSRFPRGRFLSYAKKMVAH